jgi:serine/threonine protein phosphatase PrpC
MSRTESWTDEDWQKGREEMRAIEENLHGPVTGTFIISEVAQNGSHPIEVRQAWQGVPLPVRLRHAFDGGSTVKVLCTDGINALVEAGTEEEILQYWIDILDGRADENATFDFQASDGSYEALAEISQAGE